MSASKEYSVEDSPFGRLLVARAAPTRSALFYTGIDFSGRLDAEVADRLMNYVRSRFGIEAQSFATCTQVHGTKLERAFNASGWNECDSCDALWTDATSVMLGIKVADCLPVTMIDPEHRVMVNIHSGWKGAAAAIVDQTLDTLAASSLDPALSSAFLGPSIRVCCFEVGEEVVERFEQRYDGASSWVDRSGSRPHIDLAALTRARLISRGFDAGRIFDSGVCTRCDGSIFHSHRHDPRSGRNLAVAAQ